MRPRGLVREAATVRSRLSWLIVDTLPLGGGKALLIGGSLSGRNEIRYTAPSSEAMARLVCLTLCFGHGARGTRIVHASASARGRGLRGARNRSASSGRWVRRVGPR